MNDWDRQRLLITYQLIKDFIETVHRLIGLDDRTRENYNFCVSKLGELAKKYAETY